MNRDAVPELASIRRETDARFDNAIAGIPKTDRWGLYVAVVTLHRLNDLIQHDLETLAAHCKGTGAYYADIHGRFLVMVNKILAVAQPLFLLHYWAADDDDDVAADAPDAREGTVGGESDATEAEDLPAWVAGGRSRGGG